MSPAELVLYPVVFALVFTLGYSPFYGRLCVWPFFPCVASVVMGGVMQSETWSAYTFVVAMCVCAPFAKGRAYREATQQLEEAK